MSGEGRGEGVDADATATPPEERTSLRRAGECAAADATVDAGAVVGRSGDDGAAATRVAFFGEVGEAASGWWLLSEGVVDLQVGGKGWVGLSVGIEVKKEKRAAFETFWFPCF